jgi:hypothetical protein
MLSRKDVVFYERCFLYLCLLLVRQLCSAFVLILFTAALMNLFQLSKVQILTGTVMY